MDELIDLDSIEFWQFKHILQDGSHDETIKSLIVRIQKFINLPPRNDYMLNSNLCHKIRVLKLPELDIFSHHFILSNLPHFLNLEYLMVHFPYTETPDNSYQEGIINSTLVKLDKLTKLKFLDLEFRMIDTSATNLILGAFILECTHVENKKLTISPIDFRSYPTFDDDYLKNLGENSKTEGISLNFVGENIKEACNWLACMPGVYPNLKKLSIDFLSEDTKNIESLSNCAHLSDFITLIFSFTYLEEFYLDLPTLDIREMEENLGDIAFFTHRYLKKLKIPSFSMNYLWVNNLKGEDTKVTLADIDALDEIWVRFPNLRTLSL